jgi:GWxTD domain-containing protein
MQRFRYIFKIWIVLFMSVASSFSQNSPFDDRAYPPEDGPQSFRFSSQVLVFSTLTPDTNRILLFIRLPYASLQFIKQDSIYKTSFDLSVLVETESLQMIGSQIKRCEYSAPNFEATRSPAEMRYETFQFFLPPGSYKLNLELYDLETRSPARRKEPLIVPDFRKQRFALTDILFLKTLNLSQLDSLEPLMPPVRTPEDTGFCARIDLFSARELNLSIYESILNSQGGTVYRDTVSLQIRNRRHPVFFRLNHALPFGQYTLKLHITDGEEEKDLSQAYYIRWEDQGTDIMEMELLVQSLSIIMNRESWQALNSANAEDRLNIIKDFWKKRDPTPETEINELEEEYKRRIYDANREYSFLRGGVQGWKTDRGRVYILYGSPTDVDTQPTVPGMSGRYEVWIYHQLQRSFVFQDKYNDGDYRLVSEQ